MILLHLRNWLVAVGSILLFNVSILPAVTLNEILREEIPPGVSVLVMQVQSGSILAATDTLTLFERELPIGSLIKPLLAYAALTSQAICPTDSVFCPPGSWDDSPGCWYLPGHGYVNLTAGLAFSCNVYFQDVAQRLGEKNFQSFMHTLQWNPPESGKLSAEWMIGRDIRLKMRPIQIMSYLTSLFNGGTVFDWKKTNSSQPLVCYPPDSLAVSCIRDGLRLAVEKGTGRGLRDLPFAAKLLTKTGTGPYSFDGVEDYRKTHAWAVCFFPADSPQIGILVFVKEGTGSDHGIKWMRRVLPVLLGGQVEIR